VAMDIMGSRLRVFDLRNGRITCAG